MPESKPSNKPAGKPAGKPSSGKRAKRRPLRRALAFGVAAVLFLLIGVWFFAPPLIGAIARPIVERRANAAIDGSVSIERLSLAWTGVQRLGPIELFDTDAGRVARVEAEVGVGLLKLAFGGRDLGEIVIGGRADLVRLDDGRLNLTRALHPLLEDDGEDKPDASVPPALRARLRLDGVEITYADPTESPGRVVGLRDITGSTSIRAGEPISLTLNARPVRGPSIDALTPGVGSIELAAEAGGWSASDGRITPDTLSLTASARAQRLETAFLRVLLPLGGEQAVASGGRALAAFDPVFDLAASIEFSPRRLAAEARLLAEGAEIGAALALVDGVAEITGPTGARIRGERVMAALPEFAAALAERAETITLDEYPSLEITVDALRLDLASPWSAPRAQVSVRTGPLRGTIMPPASERLPFAFTGLSADAGLNEQGELDTRARAGAVLADRDAGLLVADIRLGRVVSPEGFGFDPQGVSGTAAVSGLRTDLLEVFLGELGTALAGAIGPELDLNLEAGADELAEGAGRRLKLSASAERLRASGAVRLLEDRITGADEPLTLTASGGAELAEAILGDRIREAGFELVRAGGGVSLAITTLDLPLQREAMTEALVAGRVALDGWTLQDADGRELGADSIALVLDASRLGEGGDGGEGPVSLTLDSKLKGGGRDFGLKAELGLGRDEMLAALTEEGPFLPVLRSGFVEMRDAPLGLLAMAPADLKNILTDAKGEPVDLAALAERIAGPTLTARAEVARTPQGRSATLVALSRDTEINLTSGLDREGMPTGGTLALTVRPDVARELLERFAPEMALRPELSAATRLSFQIEPTTFPLGSGPLGLSASGGLGLRPLVIAREAGPPIDLGPIELRELSLGARFAAGWNQPQGEDGGEGEGGLRLTEALEQARLGATLQRPGGRVLGVIDANAQTGPQADGQRTAISIDASRLDPAWLDSLAGLDGLIASSLGGPGRVGVSTSVRTFAEAAERGELSITLESPLASTPEGPVRVHYSPESFALAAPGKLLWDGMAPSSNALLKALGVERAMFVDRLRFDADVQRLTIPRGAPLFDPDRFGVDVRVRALNLAVDSGAGVQRLGGSEFGLRAGPQRPGRLDFTASLTQRATGPGRAELSGSLAGYAPGGVFSLDNASIDLNAQLTRIPMALIDDLTVGGGLLREIIGPELSGEIRTAALSRAGGTLGGRLASDRASVGLSGRVRDGAFSLTEPAELAITRFGPELMARSSSVMPLIGTIEKRADDQPARVRVSSMSLPLDGNLSALDASFTVDLGSATFAATPAFEGLLRAARWDVRPAGAQRIAPLQLTIDDGVLEFADFQTQIAGGPVRARGRIDLARRTRDIVIVLPLEALSQSMVQRIRREAGPLGVAAETLTAIPFRIDGPLDAPPNPRPDLRLLIEEGARELLNPENVIRNIMEDILRPRRDGN
ncbi:MAG: hypothetical protein EA423_10485 [Phycisphaerales bacterium]|nr:MAG: hypothetical protein EA423_10485 [Phycisphaerales bacterium]